MNKDELIAMLEAEYEQQVTRHSKLMQGGRAPVGADYADAGFADGVCYALELVRQLVEKPVGQNWDAP